MSDEQEFDQLATKRSAPPSQPKKLKGTPLAEKALQADIDPNQSLGDFVQYSAFANGYMPASKTYTQLPPGVYHVGIAQQGLFLIPQQVVTDELLRLPDSKSEEVIEEIERFWSLKETFQRFGFSHKRGFLLFGPPGSGKTSTVAFVSKQLVQSGGVVIVGSSHPTVLSEILAKFRQIEPDRPLVVLLEDIDTIILKHGETETLALLDGESSIANVVFLATTNYPENLDGRVINRPSRFDRIVKIGMPSAEARTLYLKSRKSEVIDRDLNLWVEMTDGFSIAHIKELIIGVCCFGNELKNEVVRLRKMAQKPKSSDDRPGMGFT